MIHSLILMSSSYRYNNKNLNIIFKLIWLIYLILKFSYDFNLTFLFINLGTFLFVSGLIYHVSKFCSKLNKILSVTSILVYSFFIDILCYYMFPTLSNGQSLFTYVMNGFLFNYKYVFSNICLFLLFKVLHDKIFSYKNNYYYLFAKSGFKKSVTELLKKIKM